METISIRRVAQVLLGLVASLALMTACGSSGSGGKGSARGSSSGAGGAPGSGNAVEVVNFAFDPKGITVTTGTEVTWTFKDSAAHNVTAKDHSFRSDDLDNGRQYSYTFTKPGTYDYYCSIHQYMTGTVTVK